MPCQPLKVIKTVHKAKIGRAFALCRKICVRSELKALLNVRNKLFDLNAFLLHCVTVTNCYTSVYLTVKVVSNAERCSDFVLSAITLTDGTCIIEINHETLCKSLVNLDCRIIELLCKRQYCSLERSQCRMEMQYSTDVFLTVFADILFIVCIAKEPSATASLLASYRHHASTFHR